ncbi:hypothetical protein NFI96_010667 [Prochilodus magdalenae]|nr:hypothetical protein NFI96_010667 [Prochilodus magdalenae]
MTPVMVDMNCTADSVVQSVLQHSSLSHVEYRPGWRWVLEGSGMSVCVQLSVVYWELGAEQGSASNYQLCVGHDGEEEPYPLIGHELPFCILLHSLRSAHGHPHTLSLQKSSHGLSADPLQKQAKSPRFVLKTRPATYTHSHTGWRRGGLIQRWREIGSRATVELRLQRGIWRPVRENQYLGTCTWRPVSGDLYVETSIWRPVRGNQYLGTCTWRPVSGDLYVETSIWGPVRGDQYLETCTWRPVSGDLYIETSIWGPVRENQYLGTLSGDLYVETSIWGPVRGDQYLGTCTWRPVSGDLYVETSIWRPVRGDQYLETCTWRPVSGDLYVETSIWGPVRGDQYLGTCTWRPVSGDLYVETSIWRPVRGDQYLETCTWRPVSGDLYVETSIWRPVRGDQYLETCTWRPVSGDLYVENSIWRPVRGDQYLGTCTWRPVSEDLYVETSIWIPVRGDQYLDTCTWRPVSGDLYVKTSIWGPVRGDQYLETCTWRPVSGDLYVETSVWRPVRGDQCLETCTWRPVSGDLYVETSIWRPVRGDQYLGTCTWRPVSGDLYVETSIWRPVRGDQYLETCTWRPVSGDLYVETSVWRPVRGDQYLGTCNWRPVSGDLYVETSIWGPVRGDQYLGTCSSLKHKRKKSLIGWALRRGYTSQSETKNNSDSASSNKLFGQPLASVCQDGNLPKPVMDLLCLLYHEGPKTLGIFRRSANAKSCRVLKERLNSGHHVPLHGESVFTAASLFTEFLRRLPDSVLGCDWYEDWMEVMEADDQQDRCTSAKRTFSSGPQDGAPQDTAHRTLPYRTLPTGRCPQDGAPQAAAPQGGAPQDAAPQDAAPQDAAHRTVLHRPLPHRTLPHRTLPHRTLVLEKLPQVNRSLLGYVFGMLHCIHTNADVNQMTAANLALCIAPNMLWRSPPCSAEQENQNNLEVNTHSLTHAHRYTEQYCPNMEHLWDWRQVPGCSHNSVQTLLHQRTGKRYVNKAKQSRIAQLPSGFTATSQTEPSLKYPSLPCMSHPYTLAQLMVKTPSGHVEVAALVRFLIESSPTIFGDEVESAFAALLNAAQETDDLTADATFLLHSSSEETDQDGLSPSVHSPDLDSFLPLTTLHREVHPLKITMAAAKGAYSCGSLNLKSSQSSASVSSLGIGELSQSRNRCLSEPSMCLETPATQVPPHVPVLRQSSCDNSVMDGKGGQARDPTWCSPLLQARKSGTGKARYAFWKSPQFSTRFRHPAQRLASMSSLSSTTTTSSLSSLDSALSFSSTEPIPSPSDNQPRPFLFGASARLRPLTPEMPRKLWKMAFTYEEQEAELRDGQEESNEERDSPCTLDDDGKDEHEGEEDGVEKDSDGEGGAKENEPGETLVEEETAHNRAIPTEEGRDCGLDGSTDDVRSVGTCPSQDDSEALCHTCSPGGDAGISQEITRQLMTDNEKRETSVAHIHLERPLSNSDARAPLTPANKHNPTLPSGRDRVNRMKITFFPAVGRVTLKQSRFKGQGGPGVAHGVAPPADEPGVSTEADAGAGGVAQVNIPQTLFYRQNVPLVLRSASLAKPPGGDEVGGTDGCRCASSVTEDDASSGFSSTASADSSHSAQDFPISEVIIDGKSAEDASKRGTSHVVSVCNSASLCHTVSINSMDSINISPGHASQPAPSKSPGTLRHTIRIRLPTNVRNTVRAYFSHSHTVSHASADSAASANPPTKAQNKQLFSSKLQWQKAAGNAPEGGAAATAPLSDESLA